jgi:uncharacterized protein (DUF2235 family)
MGRNIVLCADGTGSTFDDGISNITRMIRLLDLGNHREQVVVYDQGLGTHARRLESVERFAASIPDKHALEVLPGPRTNHLDPGGSLARLLGLAFGYGLKSNVGEMWRILGRLYQGPEDRIFLFGFSRGAFEVRALAGLIRRCGLPDGVQPAYDVLYEQAWSLFKPWEMDHEDIRAFKKENPELRDCRIHFLGIYDTVKSYGGIRPVILPHLRHNPIVDSVRHALAMDERRAWFNATTWGRLDSDRQEAMSRLTPPELAEIARQDIQEVWFRGSHSDIGGGDREAITARVALRWMLGEALEAGLKLNPEETIDLMEMDPRGAPEIHESFTPAWRLVECLPRQEIDNSRAKSFRKLRMFWTGKRNPLLHTRDGKVLVHASAKAHGLHPDRIEVRPTKDLGVAHHIPPH